ncbi:uncharacterized protein [Elaeis guineensis]|uniref:Uncharacterized protein LOC105041376 isoform X4 n=1 Tax=Elaeis guineensis var. tenera TaxID=51953 RepID=A0A6I9R245_ELAGV|nr:uncharacterized protein LOC105041376 isoform X4 [Elaeis guineensis]
MWGEGGRFYWGRKDGREGIVVVFAWLSSQERHLKPFIELYSSFGWSSLICHADFLTLFFPEKATLLADGVLKELVKEVKIRPLPITLVAFSGGAKGCMYKVLQLIDGKCEGQLSLNMGPFLIFCSDDDELAPYPVVCTFTQRLQELGGDVKLIKWNSSPHVGHYKHHPVEYKAAVSELLCKAALVHSERRQQSHGETACAGGSSNEIPESVCSLHKAAVTSNESLRRVAIDPTDHFFLPSSMEYEAREDEKKGESFHMQNVPSINAHGVLGQILFDVCVPKNVEGWDIKPITSLNGRQSFASARRHGLFNPIKCIRRSRL